jgi:hypothetical protein
MSAPAAESAIQAAMSLPHHMYFNPIQRYFSAITCRIHLDQGQF